MKTLTSLLAVLSLAAMLAATPSDAHACGGCFGPPTATTVVTAHKMVVAIGDHQTTLWDQIQYTGSPEDFAWVLPVASTVTVELASQTFFDALDAQTQITLTAPPPPFYSCPDVCGYGYGAGADMGAASDAAAADAGVTVYHAAVVGPYETATIGSSDPMALVDWLTAHGYSVPTAMLPVIAYYVDQGSSFAALRLRPDVGIDQMQPVRVTTPGLGLSFPLRMVAAGVTDRVSLELYVFAEGRMETGNFPAEEVDRSAITYDYSTRLFSYDDQFQLAIDRGGGRGWVTEYAGEVTSLPYSTRYLPDGGVESADPDFDIVRASFSTGRTPYLSRLRTSLEPRFLDQDVVLSASAGGDLGNFISVTNVLHTPPPPVCPTTCPYPTPWRDGGTDAGGHVVRLPDGGTAWDARHEHYGCSVSRADGTAAWPVVAAVALVGLVAARRRRRRS